MRKFKRDRVNWSDFVEGVMWFLLGTAMIVLCIKALLDY